MSRFLLGALAMGAFIVLTSFAVATRLAPSPAKTTGPAWTVSQYQLDRAFRTTITFPGPTSQIGSVTLQVPMSGGIIITQVWNPSSSITVAINGISEVIPSISSAYHEFNPPIIARPGDVVTFSGAGGGQPTIAGYTTLPGET